MNLTNLITLSKAYFSESSAVTDSSWTTGEWTSFLNRAYEDILDKLVRMGSWFPVKNQTISWVSGTKEYTLTTEYKRIRLVERGHEDGAVESEQIPLGPIPFVDRHYTTLVGIPAQYYLIGPATIGMVPTPSETKTDNVKIWGVPRITELIDNTDAVTFTDADTTPTVGAASLFVTANTGSTSITFFDDGTVGQLITIIFGDANTTLVDSATLNLSGSIDYNPAADTVMQFMFNGTKWDEVARSVDWWAINSPVLVPDEHHTLIALKAALIAAESAKDDASGLYRMFVDGLRDMERTIRAQDQRGLHVTITHRDREDFPV
jgi:hypothetical protein